MQSFADTLVQVTLWSNNTQLPAQYSNVLYAYGYYSCYTLSIDLTVSGGRYMAGGFSRQMSAATSPMTMPEEQLQAT